MQGVEQEVRLQLQAEIAQLAAGEAALETRGLQLARARRVEGGEAMDGGDHDADPDHLQGQLHQVAQRHDAVVEGAETGERKQGAAQAPHQGRRGEAEDGQRQQVDRQAPRPVARRERQPERQPADREEQQPADESAGELLDERRERGPRLAGRQRGEVVIEEQQQAEETHRSEPEREPAEELARAHSQPNRLIRGQSAASDCRGPRQTKTSKCS